MSDLKSVVLHYTLAHASGAALYVSRLTTSLARGGTETWLLAPREFSSTDLAEADVRFIPLASLPSRGALSLLTNIAVRTLGAGAFIVRHRRQIRVVHLNFPGVAPASFCFLLLMRAARVRTLWTVHDVVPHRWLFPAAFKMVERALLRLSYRLADLLTVHHRSAKEELISAFGVPPNKVAIVPHGPFELGPAPPWQSSGSLTALLFGTIRRNKGVHIAVEAVQELRREGRDIELVIAGQPYASEAEYWQQCQALIATDANGIRVLQGYIPDDAVTQLLATTDVVLLPYIGFNSQSGVAVLAFSQGRPIVAAKTGGISDVLIDGRNGIAIEPVTVAGVKAALSKAIVLGRDHLKKMGRAGFDQMNRQEAGWGAIAQRYGSLYANL